MTIVTYHNGSPVPALDIRRTLPIPWRRQWEVGSSRHKVGFDALLGLKTLQLMARERFDIIHAHLHEGALLGLLSGRLFHKPVLFDYQGSMTEEMIDHGFLKRESRLYRPLRHLESWLDRKTDLVLTSSTNAEQRLMERSGCSTDHVCCLPDCVDTTAFRPASEFDPDELTALRRKLAIPANRKLIVYLGLLAEYQGTGLLLEAMARIVKERTDVHLLLMGFPNEVQYQRRAVQLGIDAFVTFTSRVPYQQAPLYLALGDIAVAPKLSLTEGSGKLLNYMAVGKPVVAFDTAVAREYLGMDGLFAVRGDVDSLAYYLQSGLFPSPGNAEYYHQLGQRLRQRAIQHFGWDTAGRQIVAIYQQLLGERPWQVKACQGWAASSK